MKRILEQYLIKTLQQTAIAQAITKHGADMVLEDVEDELTFLGLSSDISPCEIAAIIHYNLEQYAAITPEVSECFLRAGIALYALTETPSNVSYTILNIAANKLPTKEYSRIEEDIMLLLGGPMTISRKEFARAALDILDEFNELNQEM